MVTDIYGPFGDGWNRTQMQLSAQIPGRSVVRRVPGPWGAQIRRAVGISVRSKPRNDGNIFGHSVKHPAIFILKPGDSRVYPRHPIAKGVVKCFWAFGLSGNSLVIKQGNGLQENPPLFSSRIFLSLCLSLSLSLSLSVYLYIYYILYIYYTYIYIIYIYTHIRIYGLVFPVPTPPMVWVCRWPFPAPPSLLFASYWQHFWGPASAFTRYMLPSRRPT